MEKKTAVKFLGNNYESYGGSKTKTGVYRHIYYKLFCSAADRLIDPNQLSPAQSIMVRKGLVFFIINSESAKKEGLLVNTNDDIYYKGIKVVFTDLPEGCKRRSEAKHGKIPRMSVLVGDGLNE